MDVPDVDMKSLSLSARKMLSSEVSSISILSENVESRKCAPKRKIITASAMYRAVHPVPQVRIVVVAHSNIFVNVISKHHPSRG